MCRGGSQGKRGQNLLNYHNPIWGGETKADSLFAFTVEIQLPTLTRHRGSSNRNDESGGALEWAQVKVEEGDIQKLGTKGETGT